MSDDDKGFLGGVIITFIATSMIESLKTFKTRATAQRELRKWKREALAQGYEITGRVVKVKKESA